MEAREIGATLISQKHAGASGIRISVLATGGRFIGGISKRTVMKLPRRQLLHPAAGSAAQPAASQIAWGSDPSGAAAAHADEVIE
jgi:hypothetical protein